MHRNWIKTKIYYFNLSESLGSNQVTRQKEYAIYHAIDAHASLDAAVRASITLKATTNIISADTHALILSPLSW